MKIGMVCPYDIHRPGGVQQHILDSVEELRKLGHDASIIAPGPAPEGWNDTRIIHIGRHRGISFNRTHFEVSIATGSERRAMSTLLADAKFDLLHFHTVWTPILSFQIFRRFKGARVATFHDTPPPTFSGRLTRWLFRGISWFLLPRFEQVITVSEAPLRHLISGDGRKPLVYPPCVDYSRFSKQVAPLSEYTEDKFTIVFLGRLEQRKGIYEMLAAYAELEAEFGNLRLLVGGDGEEREGVIRYIESRGLETVVLLGHVPAEKTPGLYATADVFCSPALYGESFGIVLVEAMASGRPVVAAANPGYKTVLKGEGAAFLSPPGDTKRLAANLRRLIEDESLRQKMGNWGVDQAAKYDCVHVVPKLVEVYRSALAR